MKRYKKSILLSISVLAIILIGTHYLIRGLSVENDIDFNSNLWKDDIEKRVFMLADLEKYLMGGMSRNEIIVLLGEPDGNNPDGDNFTWNQKLGYDLGDVNLDKCNFIIYLDKNKKTLSWKKMCN